MGVLNSSRTGFTSKEQPVFAVCVVGVSIPLRVGASAGALARRCPRIARTGDVVYPGNGPRVCPHESRSVTALNSTAMKLMIHW